MVRNDYIPTNDNAFYDWAAKLLSYAAANYERWHVIMPLDMLQALLSDYRIKLERAKLPNHGSADVIGKNVAKAKLVKALREFVQGHIARNVEVTDVDKRSMDLPIYDRKPTPVSDPTGQATVSITFPGRTQLKLIINPVGDVSLHPRVYYGCRIYYGIYAAGEPPPKSGVDLRESKFTRRKRELFTFVPKDSGKTAYFSVRYENSRGVAGPWGAMTSAIIP